MQSKINLGDKCPTVTQGEINAVQLSLTADLQSDIAELGDSSITAVNIFNDEELITALQPNALEPFEYKGFIFVLELDPTNTFSFPRRRIRADRSFSSETSTFFTFSSSSPRTPLNGSIILYNDPGNLGRYSFASSTQILVQEMKYKIDQYLFGVVELVNLEEAIDNVGRDDSSGDDTPGDTPIFVPYTISYNGMYQFVSKTIHKISGTITIPNPPTGQNSEDIKIYMNQFGLNQAGDINISLLEIGLKSAQTISGNTDEFYNQWEAGDGYMQTHGGTVTLPRIAYLANAKSLQSDNLGGGTGTTPIVLSIPGIYGFSLEMNSNAEGVNISTKVLIETQ